MILLGSTDAAVVLVILYSFQSIVMVTVARELTDKRHNGYSIAYLLVANLDRRAMDIQRSMADSGA